MSSPSSLRERFQKLPWLRMAVEGLVIFLSVSASYLADDYRNLRLQEKEKRAVLQLWLAEVQDNKAAIQALRAETQQKIQGIGTLFRLSSAQLDSLSLDSIGALAWQTMNIPTSTLSFHAADMLFQGGKAYFVQDIELLKRTDDLHVELEELERYQRVLMEDTERTDLAFSDYMATHPKGFNMAAWRPQDLYRLRRQGGGLSQEEGLGFSTYVRFKMLRSGEYPATGGTFFKRQFIQQGILPVLDRLEVKLYEQQAAIQAALDR